MAIARPRGHVDQAFATVADAFAEGFADRGEVGAALCLIVDGRAVVDLVGGTSDSSRAPWSSDTIVNAFSVVKPIAATCLLLLVEQGLDFHIGLDERLRGRAADVVDPDGTFVAPLARPPEIADPAVVNGVAWRAAEIPAANGHGTALALARFYAALGAGGVLGGTRLLSAELVAEAVRPQLVALDRVLDRTVAWGLGLQVDLEEGGFGMGGMGGNLGWWGEEGYAIGYLTRRLGDHERVDAIDTAVRGVLTRS